MATQMRSPTSVAIGVLCFVSTLVVLFGHVKSTADLSAHHLYIVLALIVAFGAGHFWWHAKGFNMGAFLAIFIVATTIAVALGGARALNSLQRALADAVAHNTQREALATRARKLDATTKDALAALTAAESALTASIDAASTQCASGKGTRCEGSSAAIDLKRTARDDARRIHDAATVDFNEATAVLNSTRILDPAADIKPLAQLYSLLTGADIDRSVQIVLPILCYMLALLTELSAIVFINHGIERVPARVAPPVIAAAPQHTPLPPQPHTIPATYVSLADIARELKLDPRIARKEMRRLGIARPVQGWTFTPEVADDIKSRLSPSA